MTMDILYSDRGGSSEWGRCCAKECASSYGPGHAFLIGNDDIRQWACGCDGHKGCYKEGLLCENHDMAPMSTFPDTEV